MWMPAMAASVMPARTRAHAAKSANDEVTSVGSTRVTPARRIRSSARPTLIGGQVRGVEIDAGKAVGLEVEEPRERDPHDWSRSSTAPRRRGLQLRRRRLVEVHRRRRMRLQNRRRRERRHLPFEAGVNRRGLARVRHDAEDRARLQNLAHRHRDRLRRHLVDRGEPAFAHLLAPARLVQLHDEVRALGDEVRRRIVEREMSVLADADKGDVDRGRRDRTAGRVGNRAAGHASPSSRW